MRWLIALSLLIAALGLHVLGPSEGTGAPAVPAGQAQAAAITFTPVADAYISQSKSRTNYGTNKKLLAGTSPSVTRSYLRFNLQGLSDPITRATLRIYSPASSSGGYEVRSVADTTWGETSITFSNAPPFSPTVAGTSGPISSGTWTSVDVTALVGGNGLWSVAITAAGSSGVSLASRETGANAPRLVVESGASPSTATPTLSATATSTVAPPTGSDPILVGAGDIAGCSTSGDEATANLLDSIFSGAVNGAVFTAGDDAYDSGTATEFSNCYHPSWGRHKARTQPAVGNHEYGTAGASGYFGYFGATAGDASKGYYSYDLGAWHIVVVNSNCSKVGGCGAGSAQEQWLRADLAAHPAACTVAYWHHPRFSSGQHGNTTEMQPIWQALYDSNADLVLSGHDHDYERFAPQTPSGAADSTRGIREFVVGTGGRSHYAITTAIANSEVHNDNTFGVLKLTLHPTSYDWEFIPEAGKTFRDSGTGTCH